MIAARPIRQVRRKHVGESRAVPVTVRDDGLNASMAESARDTVYDRSSRAQCCVQHFGAQNHRDVTVVNHGANSIVGIVGRHV